MPAPLAVPAAIWAFNIYRAAQVARAAHTAVRAAQVARGAAQLAMAAERAEELSKEEERDKVCENCAEKIPCFEPPPDADEAEFERQLKEQQDAINQMEPDKLLERIKNYNDVGRKAAFPKDAALRASERLKHEGLRVAELSVQFQRKGSSAVEADRLARAQTASEMKNLDATHSLDLRAGGTGEVSGLGDSKVNRSIGSQWRHGRADALEKEADKAVKRGDKKMDVKLEKC